MLYTLPLRGRALEITALSPLDLGAEVMYATVVNGRVTAVTFGILPDSDDTNYYVDLSTYDVMPAVDWYFSDVCQTFSEIAPVIPAGDSAPPYTPGTPPPGTPGGPAVPDPELPPTDDPAPLASTAPFWVSFHADGVASLPIAGGADLAEVDSRMRTTVRMNDVCAVRLQAEVLTADAGLSLYLCFSNDGGTTWEELSAGKSGPKISLGALGNAVGLFLNVDPAVTGDTLVNICTKGSGSAVVGNVLACFYVKTTEGLCVEISEVGCDAPADYPIYAENFASDLYPTYEDFIALRQYPSDPDYWNLFSDLFIPATSDARASFEEGLLYPGRQALRMDLRLVDFPSDLASGWITLFESESSDVTMQWVLFLGTAGPPFDIVDASDGSALSAATENCGFVLGAWEDKAPSGEGGGRYFHYLLQRAGKVYHEVYNGGVAVQAAVEIGDAADIQSRYMQWTVRADYSGSDARLRIYLDDACPGAPPSPTLWATCTGPRRSTNSKWRSVECATLYNSRPPGVDVQIYTFVYSYNNDFSLYGLT